MAECIGKALAAERSYRSATGGPCEVHVRTVRHARCRPAWSSIRVAALRSRPGFTLAIAERRESGKSNLKLPLAYNERRQLGRRRRRVSRRRRSAFDWTRLLAIDHGSRPGASNFGARRNRTNSDNSTVNKGSAIVGGRDKQTSRNVVKIGRYTDESGRDFSLTIDRRSPEAPMDRPWDFEPEFCAGEFGEKSSRQCGAGKSKGRRTKDETTDALAPGREGDVDTIRAARGAQREKSHV